MMVNKISDISGGKERVPIPLKLDNSKKLPQTFTYIKNCVGGPGVNLPKEPFYQGCICESVCNDVCTCIAKYGTAYENKNGLVTLKDNFFKNSGYSQPVFECNSLCSCSHDCRNRLVQNGITMNLEVFPEQNKDWGLKTLEAIVPGQFVCEYAGEIISLSEAKRRTQENQGRHNYIIVIKEHVSNNQVLRTHVDPIYQGNAGRFINHSCDPNLIMIPVRTDSLIPVLALFAIKDIPENTELTFDYSGGCSNSCHSNAEMQDSSLSTIQKKCCCGSLGCLGYLPFDRTLF